uniref:RING-type domain-containing protein n=1 Tax=Panagrolaimus superbus TaxID=310955 RepID=A0A914YPX3_9BILA
MKDGISCRGNGVTDDEKHTFCSGYVKEYVGINEANISSGIAGLVCMEFTCKGALAITDMKQHFVINFLETLENRIAEENIGGANIVGLRRCRRCNYCVEVVDRCFFTCICGFKQCLICEEEYVDEHGSVRCSSNKKTEAQLLEEELSAAVDRQCHNCKLQFMKLEGCILMTCRCSATQCYLCRTPDIKGDHFCACNKRYSCISIKFHRFDDCEQLDARKLDDIKSRLNGGSNMTRQGIDDHRNERSHVGPVRNTNVTPLHLLEPFPPRRRNMPPPSPPESNASLRSQTMHNRRRRRRNTPPPEIDNIYERNAPSRLQTMCGRRHPSRDTPPPESNFYDERRSSTFRRFNQAPPPESEFFYDRFVSSRY